MSSALTATAMSLRVPDGLLSRKSCANGEGSPMSKVVASITTSVDGFTCQIELEHLGVRQSPLATFVDDRVKRS
jgi:hypothetical protein